MSTNYYLPCSRCVRKVEHLHRADNDDNPVAHTWYGGVGTGTLVTLYSGELEYPTSDDMILLSEGGSPITVGELKAKRGNGA